MLFQDTPKFKAIWKELRKKYKVKKERYILNVSLDEDRGIRVYNNNTYISIGVYSEKLIREGYHFGGVGCNLGLDGSILPNPALNRIDSFFRDAEERSLREYEKDMELTKFFETLVYAVIEILKPNSVRFMTENI